jgi:hypothetical protein
MKKRIEDIKSYINEVADLIRRYINNSDEYPKGARLLVEPVLCETVIDDPRGCRGVEQYNINRFVKIDNHGIRIPNLRAIMELAKKYYIV